MPSKTNINRQKVDKLAMRAYRQHRNNSGQALVEFVLVMVPMLVLLLLAIQYLLIWRANSYLQVAAYSAARKFAVNSDHKVAENAAMQYLQKIVSKDEVTFTFPDSTPGFAHPFSVNVSMHFPLLGVPLVRNLFTRVDEHVTPVSSGTFQGSAPPTPQSLGLQPDERLEILDSTFLGQRYNWLGNLHWKVDFYGSWDHSDLWNYRAWQDHLGHDTGEVTWWWDDTAQPPSVSELMRVEPFGNPVVLSLYPAILRAPNDWQSWIEVTSKTAVGSPQYVFLYLIVKITRTYQPDPNSITLTAGSVMNKESGE